MLWALLWSAVLGLVAAGLVSLSDELKPKAPYVGLIVAAIAFVVQVA